MALVYSREQSLKKDRFHKEEEKNIVREGVDVDGVYINDILQRSYNGSRILDIGTGTAHIPLRILEKSGKDLELVVLDLSRPMAEIAKKNLASTPKTHVVRGDGNNLPFKDRSFDLVVGKLAPHKSRESFRILKKGGWYIIQMSRRFNCWKEVEDVFGDRAYSMIWSQGWISKTSGEHLERLISVGFTDVQEKHFLVKYYYTLDQIIKQMEFDPIVKDFNKEQDMPKLMELKQKYSTDKGICITSDPLILLARKKS